MCDQRFPPLDCLKDSGSPLKMLWLNNLIESPLRIVYFPQMIPLQWILKPKANGPPQCMA